MSDTETILAAELEASRRRAEELTALLDQERKVCSSSLFEQQINSHHVVTSTSVHSRQSNGYVKEKSYSLRKIDQR
jgi:hypothetical protein